MDVYNRYSLGDSASLDKNAAAVICRAVRALCPLAFAWEPVRKATPWFTFKDAYNLAERDLCSGKLCKADAGTSSFLELVGAFKAAFAEYCSEEYAEMVL